MVLPMITVGVTGVVLGGLGVTADRICFLFSDWRLSKCFCAIACRCSLDWALILLAVCMGVGTVGTAAGLGARETWAILFGADK